MAFTNQFKFVGKLMLPKESSKMEFVKNISGKTPMKRLNFGIKAGDNMMFVESFGASERDIYTLGKEKGSGSMTVSWEDREDPEIMDSVAGFKKFIVNLGEDYGGRKEFIAEYDFIEYLEETLPDYEGNIVALGNYVLDPYKGKMYDKYQVNRVYSAAENQALKLEVDIDLYYNKECVDKSEFKSNKRITVNGYIDQYDRESNGHRYFPQQVIFDATKFDMGVERHVKNLKYKLGFIETSSKKFVHIPWECRVMNGAQAEAFDESMLTDAQRTQIELGLSKLSDFRPKGSIYGNRIKEIRLGKPLLVGSCKEGLEEVADTAREFEDKKFVFLDESSEDVMASIKEAEEIEEKKSKKKPASDDVDALFDDDDDLDLFV